MEEKQSIIEYTSGLDLECIRTAPKLPKGRRRRSERPYIDLVTAFDIETTNVPDLKESFMYIWQMQFDNLFTVIGRKWSDFSDMIRRISDILNDRECGLVCYVHNLSFEWQYIKSWIPVDKVLALDDRKILTFLSGPVEFRCSYLHANMGLDKYLKYMGVPDQKLTLDYNKIRYPDTPLSDAELQYAVNDVRGLVQAIKTEMKRDKDDLYTVPLTSTGYIRRIARDRLAGYIRYIKPMFPDLDTFHMLRAEFRGGNTHAHRMNAGKIITNDIYPIYSVDISSSYPSQLLRNKYPGEFVLRDVSHFEIAMKYKKAFLASVRLYDVCLKNPLWGCPYLAEAKCDNVVYYDNIPEWRQTDNGRILQAKYLEAVFNEIDFAILESEYTFKYEITRLYTARKSYLPDKFRDLIMEEYTAKTALKDGDEYLYSKIKNRFNSLYGMMVQNPCKPELVFDQKTLDVVEDYSKPLQNLIDEYHDKGWLPYQWGVWCTSYARLQLENGLNCIPPEAFIYADTDSIKFQGNYLKNFEILNRQYIREEYSAVDKKGRRHYMGIFEKDGEYNRFVTMGAKKYAYEDDTGLHITVAGVRKESDKDRGLVGGAEELGCIEKFRTRFVFKKAAGTQSLYNDYIDKDTGEVLPPQIVNINGHEVELCSNIYIEDSTYTLSEGLDYQKLLNYLSNTDIRYSLHYER